MRVSRVYRKGKKLRVGHNSRSKGEGLEQGHWSYGQVKVKDLRMTQELGLSVPLETENEGKRRIQWDCKTF